jgi:hypothetical protein
VPGAGIARPRCFSVVPYALRGPRLTRRSRIKWRFLPRLDDPVLGGRFVLTIFEIPAGGIPEAVATHPPRKLVPLNGRIVARDGAWLPAPVVIARLLVWH